VIIGVRLEDPHKLEIGKIYHNKRISDLSGKYHNGMSFLVIREATFEEWIKQHPKTSKIRDFSKDKFYEISVD